jgi:hypothetical protein
MGGEDRAAGVDLALEPPKQHLDTNIAGFRATVDDAFERPKSAVYQNFGRVSMLRVAR